jgi:hypothetical protein
MAEGRSGGGVYPSVGKSTVISKLALQYEVNESILQTMTLAGTPGGVMMQGEYPFSDGVQLAERGLALRAMPGAQKKRGNSNELPHYSSNS